MSAIIDNCSYGVESLSSCLELSKIEESELENSSGTPVAECFVNKLKHTDTQDSISSNDSDISMSYDSPITATEPAQTKQADDAHMADLSDSLSDSCDKEDKDSGCEVVNESKTSEVEESSSKEEEQPFEPPDEELTNRIIAQVEFYFSDVNITKDAFLLKHVKRNKEGYVSLKLIASFKRVKHLAKDWRVVGYALQKSTKLEINESGTKLRRVDPLPPFDQTAPSRTIVAINLPMEKPTIESVAELFKACGEIALIRILRPGNPIPADVRSFFNKHPEMGGTMSALVEFDRTEFAKLAIERQDSDWRTNAKGMKVVELNAPPSIERKKRSQSKKTTVAGRVVDRELSSSCLSSSEAETDLAFRQRRSSSPSQIPWVQRRLSTSRDEYRDQYTRQACSCCCDRRYSSSGSGYDSPIPGNYRRLSITRDINENNCTIPYGRRISGGEGPCCVSSRRYSRDSGSESSTSFGRPHDTRRFSRDSASGSEGRRYSRESVSSENGFGVHRRLSRDSVGSDAGYVPPFFTRSNSRDVMEATRRSSASSLSGCEHHGSPRLTHRPSFNSATICMSACPPHMSENVVRMPKGPDGSKGFGQ